MTVQILKGDCRDVLRTLPAESVDCVVTSPPYFGLRDYGVTGQIGLEASPSAFVDELASVCSDVRRVLRPKGTLWVNLGDSYASSWPCSRRNQIGAGSLANGKREARAPRMGDDLKEKDLIGIPWATAFALRLDGWWLRSAIVWAKPNGMPGSQDDRCTSSYEMVFQFSASPDYWSDFDAIKTPPREATLARTAQDIQAQAGSHRANGGGKTNGTMKAVGGLTGTPHGRHSLGEAVPKKELRSDKRRGHSRVHAGFNDRWDAMERSEQQARPAMMRDVWFISPGGYDEAHFAVMADEVARRCILAGCPEGGTVLDPFGGAGTTGLVADRLGRNAILIELNPEYADMAERRISGDGGMFASVEVSHGT